MYRKKICDDCNIDGKCDCQKSQKRVDNCGMETVMSQNKVYRREIRNGTLTFPLKEK